MMTTNANKDRTLPSIIDEHDSEFIVYVNGKITTIPNDSYSIVSKLHFNGNRIIYKFADFVSITETYNPRIFNLVYDQLLHTVRQDMANIVCDCILDYHKTGNYTKYKEFFLDVYSREHKDEIIESFILGLSPLIKIESKSFTANGIAGPNVPLPVCIVNNAFAIDAKGVSYFKNEKDDSWTFLCTVVETRNQSYRIPLKKIGWIELSEAMNNVISKIIFFLHPNPKDGVFTGQLKELSPALYSAILGGTYIQNQ